MRKAIILDRDGTLLHPVFWNQEFRAARNLEEVHYYRDAREFCATLRELTFDLFVLTNQPDVSTGGISHEDNSKINNKITKELGLTKVYTCVHSKRTECHCRKPNVGLVQQIIRDFGAEVKIEWVIGDRSSDSALAERIGARAIQLPCFGIERNRQGGLYAYRSNSLIECLRWIEKG